MNKRYIALIAAVGIAIGWLTFGGTQAVLHATSSTEFCVSCHTMEKPLHEYQGSVHFSNQKAFVLNVQTVTFLKNQLIT